MLTEPVELAKWWGPRGFTMPKAGRRLLTVTLLLVLTACSGGGGAQPESSPTVDIGGGGTATETPGGAAEQTLAPRGGNRGITVASLPVGGGSGGAFENSGVQCVRVNWLLSTSGAAIPAGLAVNITGSTFRPDVFRPADSPCEGPPCIGFTFKSSEVACDLPIRPRKASDTNVSDVEQVTLSMQGRVLCTDYASSRCKSFAAEVRARPKTLKVPLPIAPDGPAKPTPGSG
jgi:hypothetical protein